MCRIEIIVLNYNSPHETIRCCKSIGHSDDIGITIVDNASTDDSVSVLTDFVGTSTCVKLLISETNGGYAAGNNLALKRLKQDSDVDYICIVNSDVVIGAAEIKLLAAFLSSRLDVTLVGPVLLEPGGLEIVQSRGMTIDLWTGFTSKMGEGERYDPTCEPYECDMLEGSCLVFRRADLDTLGFLPEEYFLYYEETEWCLRVRRNGYKVYCIPQACAMHEGSSSTSKIDGLRDYFMRRNRALFLRRNATNLQFYYYCARQVTRGLVDYARGRRTLAKRISAVRDALSGEFDSAYKPK